MTIAVPAPVPLEHLQEGQAVCDRDGRVAFGSQMWEVFRVVVRGTPVLIYASHAETRTAAPSVTWTARYLTYVHSQGGEHPKGMRVRPAPTKADANGYWAGFYEVADLAPLPEDAIVPIGDLRDRDARTYLHNFVPRAPDDHHGAEHVGLGIAGGSALGTPCGATPRKIDGRSDVTRHRASLLISQPGQ